MLSSIDKFANDTFDAITQNFDKLGITDNTKGDERMAICSSCDEYLTTTKQCRICSCYMPLKTKLSAASCPIKQW